jgi:hypothetical protein
MSSRLTIGFVVFVGVCAILMLVYVRLIKRSPEYKALLQSQGTPMLVPARKGTSASAAFACIFGLLTIVPFAYLSTQNMQDWRHVSYPLQQQGIVVDATILEVGTATRGNQYVVYEYVAATGVQAGVLLRRTEGVEKDVLEEANNRYYEALKAHRQPYMPIRYLPDNPEVARLDTSVHPRTPFAQVAFILGMMAFGMLLGVVPTQIGVWRWLIPHGYMSWAIGSILSIYGLSIGTIFWLSAR